MSRCPFPPRQSAMPSRSATRPGGDGRNYVTHVRRDRSPNSVRLWKCDIPQSVSSPVLFNREAVSAYSLGRQPRVKSRARLAATKWRQEGGHTARYLSNGPTRCPFGNQFEAQLPCRLFEAGRSGSLFPQAHACGYLLPPLRGFECHRDFLRPRTPLHLILRSNRNEKPA